MTECNITKLKQSLRKQLSYYIIVTLIEGSTSFKSSHPVYKVHPATGWADIKCYCGYIYIVHFLVNFLHLVTANNNHDPITQVNLCN